MTESISHKSLKAQARQILLERGYLENKIKVDTYWFTEKLNEIELNFRVDVFATNGHNQAIECGNFPLWKRPYYYKHFGEENVLHIPYPPHYGRYLLGDIEKDQLTPEQAKQYLIDTYKKYVFGEFKEDEIYSFLELENNNERLFDLGPHGKYREINPDYGYKEEIEGHRIWMNFPTERTLNKKEFRDEIHIGMVYHQKDIFQITIILSGKESMEKFLKLSSSYHDKILNELKKLPLGFKIRQGFSFWDKAPVPPLNKEWESPIECSELTKEDYEEMLVDQKNLIYLSPFKRGPTMELVKIYLPQEEIPEALSRLKPLYKLLIKPRTEADELVSRIKHSNLNWKHYVYEKYRKDLYENLCDELGEKIDEPDFNKAWKMLKQDPDYLKYERRE